MRKGLIWSMFMLGKTSYPSWNIQENNVLQFRAVLFILIFVLSFSNTLDAQDHSDQPLVFAASSLTTVLTEQAEIWSKNSGIGAPRLSFGSSASMARQIQAGAPAHLFISANPYWSELLKKSSHALELYNLAKNQLVLVVPKRYSSDVTYEATPAFFQQLLNGRRIAIADPKLAPAGAYAKTYLRRTALWESLKNKAAYGQSVRQTLRLAEQGGLPAFVYRSDALSSNKVTILYNVPIELSGAIIYQAALLEHNNAAATSFLAFLRSEKALPIWLKHGFDKIDLK